MQLSMQAQALAGAPAVGPWGEGVTQELVRTALEILTCTADACVEYVFFALTRGCMVWCGCLGDAGAPRTAGDDVVIKQVVKSVVEWGCSVCKRECIPVRDESRCMWYVIPPAVLVLCTAVLTGDGCTGDHSGHRLKHHKANPDDKRKHFRCGEPRCNCRRFFYVVAEGGCATTC